MHFYYLPLTTTLSGTVSLILDTCLDHYHPHLQYTPCYICDSFSQSLPTLTLLVSPHDSPHSRTLAQSCINPWNGYHFFLSWDCILGHYVRKCPMSWQAKHGPTTRCPAVPPNQRPLPPDCGCSAELGTAKFPYGWPVA